MPHPLEAAPDHVDVLAQRIDLIGERERYRPRVRHFLELVQPPPVVGNPRAVEPFPQFELEKLELAVQAVNPRAYAPGVQPGRELQDRDQHREQRHQHHDDPVHQRRRPERHEPLQERRPGLEEPLRRSRSGAAPDWAQGTRRARGNIDGDQSPIVCRADDDETGRREWV